MVWGRLLVGLVATALGARSTPTIPPDSGRLEIVSLESRIFGNVRNLRVWLPPRYDTDGGSQYYPVLYLNDGQNLFDSATAVFGNAEWGVDETLMSLIESGRIEPVIVVGIDNAGRRGRAREYLPYPDQFLDPPEPDPQGRQYGAFLADEVIPLVESRFRVSRHPGGRTLGGSSYGALVSLFTAVTRPDLFSGLLLESPSFYVDDDHILRDVDAAGLQVERIYVGVGTNELALEGCPDHPGNAEAVNGVLRLAEILRSQGLGDGELRVQIQECAIHHESAWANRLPAALEFLYTNRVSGKGPG